MECTYRLGNGMILRLPLNNKSILGASVGGNDAIKNPSAFCCASDECDDCCTKTALDVEAINFSN
jgi:hypothetical protein